MRATAASILLGLLLVAGGCGSSTGVGAGDEDTPTIISEEPEPSPDDENASDSYTTSWWMVGGHAEPGSGPPPAKALAVFQEPATSSDALPSTADEDGLHDDGVPEKYRPGRELHSQSRLLLTDAGAESFDLFGVPTEKGWVCIHLVATEDAMGSGQGTCIPALAESVAYSMGGTPAAYEVFGLIANDVRGVRVVSGKRSERAVVGRNAFFFQADPKAICPTEIEALILEKAKGPTEKVSLELERTSSDRASFGCS